MRRVAIQASARGNGKTTLGRALAAQLGVPTGTARASAGRFSAATALLPFALRSHFRRRREYPDALAQYNVRRLRTTREVAEFLRTAGQKPPCN